MYTYPGKTAEQQGHMGRAEMISTPFREYERQIRQQFTDMFARTGFDASRDIAGIILNRWGHAYASPAPGFYFGKDGKPAPGDVLRAAPFGRIAFANTDLSGMPDHKSSIIEADRASWNSCWIRSLRAESVWQKLRTTCSLSCFLFVDLDAERLQEFQILIADLELGIGGESW